MDTALEVGESDVVNGKIRQDGEYGSPNKSDLANREAFDALLAHVRRTLAKLTDQILDGEININPYMLGQETPCSKCAFPGVCRFERRSGYHMLNTMTREAVLKRVVEEGGERK